MTIQSPVQPPAPPTGQPPVSLLSPNPLGVGDLIDRSFRLYRRNFKAFLYMAAVLLLPWTIISGFFTQSAMQNQLAIMQEVMTQGASDPAIIEQQFAQLTNTAGFLGLSLLLSLVGGILYALTYLGLFTLVIRSLRGESTTLSAGFAGARSNFWAAVRLFIIYLALVLAFMVVVMLLFLAIAFVFGGSIGVLSGSGGDSEGAAAVFFAMCCLMPILFALVGGPIIYFYTRWSVVMPALVDNQAGARRSMRISWDITKGNMWRVIGFFFLVGLLTFVVFALPFYMIQGVSLLFLGMDMLWLSALLTTVLTALLNTLWLPLTAILPTMLYFDLRTRDNLAKGRSSAAMPAIASSPTLVGQPTVSTPPYVGPTWAPEAPAAPPSAPTSPATPSTTPSAWSQNDEPDDPWDSPTKPPASDNP